MVVLQMFRTNDPVADAEAYINELEDALALMPVCSECGEHIQNEHCFVINDEIICESCMNKNYRKYTMDLIG